MEMSVVTQELVDAKPYFQTFNPSWRSLLRGKPARVMRRVGTGLMAVRTARALGHGAPVEAIIGNFLGSIATRKISRPIRRNIVLAHRHVRHIPTRDPFRKNGMGGHYWHYKPGRHDMVIVFHDAYRAGPHIDIHIGRFSMVRRVKPEVYEQLRYNNQGYLTQDSKKILLDFLRDEVDNNTRIPQNLDHSVTNTRAQWLTPEHGKPPLMPWAPEFVRQTEWFQEAQRKRAPGYGAGDTRQVIFDAPVDIYKAHHDGPIEVYAPKFNPYRGMYIYRLYPGSETRAPILVWGNLTHEPPALNERLHLKFIQPQDMDKMLERSDPSTSTAKYDGSSCYVVITPKGTTVWSPRVSRVSGKHIEYTYMLDGIANVTAPETIVAMGELMFHKPTPFWETRERKEFLPQATGGGLLNGQAVLPKGIHPEIYLYRVDRIGRTSTVDLPFWQNRSIQERISSLAPDLLKVVELMDPDKAQREGFEGVVMAPPDGSINEGAKTKWTMDPHDWQIDKIEYHIGPRGGVAGVARMTSLESGKKFKLGPGQMGDHELTLHMAEHPEQYEGAVVKVASRIGHEGRAAKVVGFHDAKGVAPALEIPQDPDDEGTPGGRQDYPSSTVDRIFASGLVPRELRRDA